MNNGLLHIEGNNSRTTTINKSVTDQLLRTPLIDRTAHDTSLDLTDVSIRSVGLQHCRYHNHEMLTDDEIVETSDDEDNDDDEDEPFPSNSTNALLNNNNSDDMDFGLIDPDTQAKLAAILEATGITNSAIPDEFWRDQQVVRLLTSSVTNNFNSLHEITSAIPPSNRNPSGHQERIPKSTNKDTSGTFVHACMNNDIRTVEKLLKSSNGKEHISDVNEDGDSILAIACSNGYTDLVRLLLTIVPDIDVDDRGSKQDCTPLMEACNAGHYDIVELLLKHNANVNIQSTSGNTALHYSAGGGYADIVRLLLDHGAKVEETNENGHTPLMEAASGGHVEVARALLDHGAGVNTLSNDSKDKNGNDTKQHKTDEMHTALMEACMDGHVQVAKLLLDHGADVNMPPDSYESPLTLSACGGHIELASLLIERGANLEEVNDEGYTPLMEASREGHDDLVNLLVSRGADVNRTTEDTQETALTLACAGGFLEVAKILLSNGANVNLGQSTPLMEASQEGHVELVQYLIQNGADINQTTPAGETALAYACESGHSEVAEILLNSGAHIDQAENEGRTPLMKAARAGHLCTVRYLISKGADVNRATNSNDSTVLSLACAGGHLDLASLLLKHGADPNHLLKDRSNCLIEAAKGGHTEIVKLLLEYPKSVTQRTQTVLTSSSVEPLHDDITNENDDERDKEQNLTVTVPNTFLLSSAGDSKRPAQTPDSPIQLLKSLQKIVPRNSLDILQANVNNESIKSNSDNDAKDNLTCILSSNDQTSSPVVTNIPEQLSIANSNSDTSNIQQTKRLQILEQLQHVEKELHDKAQEQLKINQDYRQQVNDYVNSNSLPSPPTVTGKKKRTTSSSSISSSSSETSSSSSTAKQDEQSLTSTSNLTLPVPTQPINFFSASTNEINQSSSSNLRISNKSSMPPFHHNQHHPKIKKSFNRQLSKFDRRLEQNIHDNQTHFDHMNLHLKNLKLLSPPSAECVTTTLNSTKMPMRINTDTQKALEHLRELASNPSELERIQKLANNPNLIQEIKKVANQSFNEQLRTLPPFTPANLQQIIPDSLTVENKFNTEAIQKTVAHVEPVIQSPSDTTVQTVTSTIQVSSQPQPQQSFAVSSTTRPSRKDEHSPLPMNHRPPSLPNTANLSTIVCCGECPPQPTNTLNPTLSHLHFQNRIDVDCETESNHDTALTLSCAGGHEELVTLLLQRGANIEHRDKKGFTPLILAATAGHTNIVAKLLESGANIEAQSERTKDTALSLACSGGRQEVVEVLLKKGANREHRNVSDYTALSLAASGGYVNIIRLLLNYGAEINSRTGSKLGITPLMLASMNGHVAAAKLLLDMGADINAQIETNRNTALTLACFQGRSEVVSLLVERKANIEHRAKTGLTPLMESASGGYVDVGRVLLERGADVNAPPVPTSKDTALTIAADKGHHKFVELLLMFGATIDVRNKKGATPLWLACNNGHLEVVQLLVTRFADPDSCDSRKVSCLMAAFRKGHCKVIKYLVRQVRQFPSDADCRRLINTVTDKDLLKRCQTCMDQIISAKERQAAEANKAANSLLKEIDLEKSREEIRKVAAAKKREKRKAKKKGKQKTNAAETNSVTKTDEQPEHETDEQNENIEVSQQETPTVATDTVTTDDNLPVQVVQTESEQLETANKLTSPDQASPPVTPSKQSSNNSKKKTNTMARKIERYQENLVSKSKQQEASSTASHASTSNTDDGWQEVIGKQKKIIIPHDQYSRIIGRSGSNLNVLRETTGASIDIENKKGIGDKTIVIKGNGDSIKHAHQLIMVLLKNSETELTDLLASNNENKTKSRSTTITSTNESSNDELNKTAKTNNTNHGSKVQSTDSAISEIHVSSPTTKPTVNSTRLSNTPTKKPVVTKTPQQLTTTGATWVNSNRLNRAASSSGASTNVSNSSATWNPQLQSSSKPSNHNKSSNTNLHSTNQTAPTSSYHHSYANTNSANQHSHYGHLSNKQHSINYHQKGEYSTSAESMVPHSIPNPLVPSQPGHRILAQQVPISSAIPSTSLSSESISPPLQRSPSASVSTLLVTSSTAAIPNNKNRLGGEYNPFASNILTTSIADVLTKNKELTPPTDETNSTSATKMNFANVAKMNMPTKPTQHEPILITMNESLSLSPDPKAAPGYRGPPSAATTPIHHQQQMLRTTNFDSPSPTSQLIRAPGAKRHPQSISPSINNILTDQNGQAGSSTTSSTSSSPSSIKQQANQFIQPQPLFNTIDQQPPPPLAPIGSHRLSIPATATDAILNESHLQMRTKFNRTLSGTSASMYQQQQQPPQPASPILHNAAYANLSRSRSNLNPTAPEFQQCNRLPPPSVPQSFISPPAPAQIPMSNGPLSANIMNIARMMEQQQQQQQQPIYTNKPNPPIHPLSPSQPMMPPQAPIPQVIPPMRPPQQADMEAMQQHVQNQVLHFWRLHANQQPVVPPPPQLPTTLQIANILASKGQLPQDPNQAAALVATYYYTNFLSRTLQTQQATPATTTIPLSSNVNKNVYETINIQQSIPTNKDDIPLNTVDPINGPTQAKVIVDPNIIIATSNHASTSVSTPSSASTNTVDHKMVPAAIGSERKRQMPIPTGIAPMPIGISGDWSSVPKQSYTIDPYLQQQTPLPSEYQQQQQQQQPMRDYTR